MHKTWLEELSALTYQVSAGAAASRAQLWPIKIQFPVDRLDLNQFLLFVADSDEGR
jgi:hypothetical protein